MSVITSLLFKSYVKATTGLSLRATLPRQTAPGWAIAAKQQEHRLIGTLNQENRAFPPFTEEQELKKHSPRSGWKHFLERCRNEIQESFQEDTSSFPGTHTMASVDCSDHPEYHLLFLLNKPRGSTTIHLRIPFYLPETLHNTSPFPTHPFCSCSQGLCTSHSLPAAFQWPAMISKPASLECLTTTVYYSYKFWCHLSGAPNKQQHH